MTISYLTEYGNFLRDKFSGKKNVPTLAESTLNQVYDTNRYRLKSLNTFFSNLQRVYILGPGHLDSDTTRLLESISAKSRLAGLVSPIVGIQLTSFIPNISVDIVAMTHVTLLMASLFSPSPPKVLIHGVYSKSPPIIKSSCAIRWYDPYLKGKNINVKNIFNSLNSQFDSYSPQLPIPRNVFFFAVFNIMRLGAKEIVLCGFDADTPTYYFDNDEQQRLLIAKSVLQVDPWISTWDGRNERIRSIHGTAHRQLEVVSDLLIKNEPSAVGSSWRLFEMERAIGLLLKLAPLFNCNVMFNGESKFLKRMKLRKLVP